MKEMLKTLINGLKLIIPTKISELKNDVLTIDAAIDLSYEMGIAEPTTSEDNFIFVDNNGNIYSL